MNAFLWFLAYAAAMVVVLAAVAWLGLRVRRRGAGSEFMGPIEELYYPTARQYRAEIQTQQERGVTTPTPDDHA